MLWIKGFGLSPDEAEAGFTGHYAEMRVVPTEKGLFTLEATRVERPLEKHPQRKRPPERHPNWGHPILRAVKKGKLYTTLEAASAELERLHIEFPDVTIPGVNKLYLIVYEKRAGIKQPTRKITLELTQREGGFTITCHDNEKSTAADNAPRATGGGADTGNRLPPGQKAPQPQVGAYTANELLRKKKRAMRRKRSDPRISKKIAPNPHESE